MDIVAALTDTTISEILVPTTEAFYPKLLAHKHDIEGVTRKTFQYGITERHQLDVYYPSQSASGGKAPILFFEYGGGFVTGHRVLPAPFDLVYRNFGTFFAKLGIFAIIADYRLVPPAKFPEPAEDIGQAIKWVVDNVSTVSQDSSVRPDTQSIFLLGNSAGAAHVSTLIFSSGLLSQDLRNRLRGVILLGGVYTFPVGDLGPQKETIRAYYGEDAEVLQNQPLSLLEKAPEELLKGLPKVLVLIDQWEPTALEKDHERILKTLKAKGVEVEEDTLKGHNHISPAVSLSSGEGEEWGRNVAEWIHKTV